MYRYNYIFGQAFLCAQGELGRDPAERWVKPIDPLNLIQVILAEGKMNSMKRILPHTRILAEAIVLVALSAVLNTIKLYQLPYGGSITLAGMVPLLWLSLRRGAVVGTYAGIVLGLVVMVIEPYLVNPIQVLLDYPMAFGALGVAGLFRKKPVVGVSLGMLGRFIAHFISGVAFFYMYAEYWGLDPITYSIAYNGSYLLPEFIVSAFIIYALSKKGILDLRL